MRTCLLLCPLLIGAQSLPPDSLQALFEKDFTFDIVAHRSFPYVGMPTDTYPVVPFLSGHVRLGLSWYWRIYRSIRLVAQPGFAWYRQAFEATSASDIPYADQMPQGYRSLKYRMGALYLQAAIRWQKERKSSPFPKYWVEVGGWLQRRLGQSLKYIAVREGRVEKVRWEGVSLFSPWQGGAYLVLGWQWLGANLYYHMLPLHPSPQGGPPFPKPPRIELGFTLSL